MPLRVKPAIHLYRTLLRTALQIDEMQLLGENSHLEDLIKSRGRFLIEEPLEGSHCYDESLQARLDKGEIFNAAMELFKKENTNRFLSSTFKIMMTGRGNYTYRKTLEDGIVLYMTAYRSPDYKHALDESHVADRQNRVLQKAISMYSDRLAQISQGQNDAADASIKTTVFDLPEKVVVEVTDEKQTVFIHTGSVLTKQELHGASVVELEKLPGCIVHQSIFSRAQRVLDAILGETDFHRSRKTFLVGHGLGGAVATVVGLLLLGEQFEVANTITLGPLRSIETTKKRYVHRLNIISAMIEEDPSISLPVNSDRHQAFKQYGEILVLHPDRPQFSIEDYNTYLCDPNMPLSYSDHLEAEESDRGPLADMMKRR